MYHLFCSFRSSPPACFSHPPVPFQYTQKASVQSQINLHTSVHHLCTDRPPPLTHVQAEESVREEGHGEVTHGLRALRQRLRKRERSVRVLHVLDVDALPCLLGEAAREERAGGAQQTLDDELPKTRGGREDNRVNTAPAARARDRHTEFKAATNTNCYLEV